MAFFASRVGPDLIIAAASAFPARDRQFRSGILPDRGRDRRVPDAVYGEEVVSYVVPRPSAGVDVGTLLRYCNDGLPAFKAPKHIVVCAELPKTERGKLDRRALAERWSREARE
jgi:acyl-CoA synthetase (AMP-forming)/AMP-acid ligase II